MLLVLVASPNNITQTRCLCLLFSLSGIFNLKHLFAFSFFKALTAVRYKTETDKKNLSIKSSNNPLKSLRASHFEDYFTVLICQNLSLSVWANFAHFSEISGAQCQHMGVLMRKHWFSTGNGTDEIKWFIPPVMFARSFTHHKVLLYCQTFYLSTAEPLSDLYQCTEPPHDHAKYTTANDYYYKIQQQTWYSTNVFLFSRNMQKWG